MMTTRGADADRSSCLLMKREEPRYHALADHATTVVGRGIYLWVAVQSLSQLEAVYGKARAQVLKDNMETHLYYPPNDLVTAKHIARVVRRHISVCPLVNLKRRGRNE